MKFKLYTIAITGLVGALLSAATTQALTLSHNQATMIEQDDGEVTLA